MSKSKSKSINININRKPLLNKISRRLAWLLCRPLPVEHNKIVIISYDGRGYGDNPKALAAELLRRKADCRIVWLTADEAAAASLPQGISSCPYGGARMIRELATAGVWIDNCRLSPRYKKPGQIYIQTWHGFALKRIEQDAASSLPDFYPAFARRDSAAIDLIVSDSALMSRIYRSSFWYDGEVREFGSPRNDIMQENPAPYREKVGKALGLPEDCQIALYAPTFRADHSLAAYCLDYERLRRALEQRFGGRWAVLIRLHPNISQKAATLSFDGDTTFNASPYPDMQELLAAVDTVISDYSSLMFDFALTGRPCWQFAADIDAYRADRNFYLPLDELPFPLARDNDEMESNILAFDENAYSRELQAFLDRCGIICDGQAARRTVDWLLNKMEEKHT